MFFISVWYFGFAAWVPQVLGTISFAGEVAGRLVGDGPRVSRSKRQLLTCPRVS
jgi:hypothetical protein